MLKSKYLLLAVFALLIIDLCWSSKLGDVPRWARPEGYDHSRSRLHKPEAAPQSFDCQARILAYNYAMKLQGWRGNLQEVFDALQLETLCNQSTEYFKSKIKNPVPEKYRGELMYYISATNGSDSNDGSLFSPFLSIQRGVEACRMSRNINDNSNPCALLLREGTFYLNDTITLGPEDSNMLITNYNGEEVYVSGGIPLQLNWQPYNVSSSPVMTLYNNSNNVYGQALYMADTATIKYMGSFDNVEGCIAACNSYNKGGQQCQSFTYHTPAFNNSFSKLCYVTTDSTWGPVPEAEIISGRITQMNVYVADLKGQNVKSMLGLQQPQGGKRAIRSRYPNADTETAIFPQGWILFTEHWLPPKDFGPSTTLFVSTPERSDMIEFQQFSLGLGGACSIFTPPESYWCSANCSGGGAALFITPTGLQFYEDYIVGINMDWTNVEDIVMHVWHPAHWAMWMYQVDGYDAENTTVSWSYGGFQGARGAGITGGSGGEWFIDNLFEALDTPNEYYYDEDNELLYYFYNNSNQAPPSDFQLDASNLKVLIDVIGTQSNPVVGLTISGINFVNAAYTYLDPHGVPSGGDWAMQRTAALQFEGTEYLTIQKCLFQRLDGNALLLSGYNRNTTIEDNEFAWIGDSCMVAWGYAQGIDGTDGNQPRFTTVTGNIAREMGIFEKQASAWFQGVSCQTLIEGNIFFNGPRALINFNDGFGGANEIVNNLLFNPNRDTSDQGPFNSWDRLPFITDVRDGTPSVTPAYNNIHNNLWICNYGSNMCIDNDDGSSYYLLHDNFEVYGGHKSDFGGHNKFTYNTVMAYAQDYIEGVCGLFNDAVPKFVDGYYNNICIQGVDVPYIVMDSCSYPTPPNPYVIPLLKNNTVYSPNGNLTVWCEGTKLILTEAEFQAMGFDEGSVGVAGIPSDDQIISWGKKFIGM